MPQSNAPSLLDYIPQPKPNKKIRPYDPSSDARPEFNLSFPLEHPSRIAGGGSLGGSDRDYDSNGRMNGHIAGQVRQTKKTPSPTRNRNAGGLSSPIRGKDLEPLIRSSLEGDIYRDVSFSMNRYQQDNYSTSAIIEAGSTHRFGQHINFTIRRIYNGCFSVDIGVRDTSQQWQVLIQKVEATDHIMRLWEVSPRICESNIGILGTWLLSCTKLDFDNSWVIGARFEYASLRELCAREIFAAISRAAVVIQANVRRYLVLRYIGRRLSNKYSYEGRFPVRSNSSSKSSLSSEFSHSLTSSLRMNSHYHSPIPPSYRMNHISEVSSPSRRPESDFDRGSMVRFMPGTSDSYVHGDHRMMFSESDKTKPRKPGAPKGRSSVKRGRTLKPKSPSRSSSPRAQSRDTLRSSDSNSRQLGRERARSRGGSRSRSPRGRQPLASERYNEQRANRQLNPVKKLPTKKTSMASHVPVKPDLQVLSLELKQMRERMELLQDTLKLQNEYREKLDAKASEEIRQARLEADDAIKKAKADALLEILNLFRGGADINNIVNQLTLDRTGPSSSQESRRVKPLLSREGLRAASASNVDRCIYSVKPIEEEPDCLEEDSVESQNAQSRGNGIVATGLPNRNPMPPHEGKRQKSKSFRVTKQLPNPQKTGGASTVNSSAAQQPAKTSVFPESSEVSTTYGDLSVGSSLTIVPSAVESEEFNYSVQQLQKMQASDVVVEKLKQMSSEDDDMTVEKIFDAIHVAADMSHTGLLGLSMERLCRILSHNTKIKDIEYLDKEAAFFMKVCRDFSTQDTAFSSIIGCIGVIVEKLDVTKMHGKPGAKPPIMPKGEPIRMLCENGLIQFLLSSLELRFESEKFAYQILTAMTDLAKVKLEYERALCSKIGARSILSVLQEHKGSQKPMEAVSRWIIQCCRDSVSAQESLCQEGITATIPGVMQELLNAGPLNKYNESTASTIVLLCKAGLALCSDNNRENLVAFSSPDNCTILVNVLIQLNAYNSSACENVLWLLLNTVSASAETRGNIYRTKLPMTLCALLNNRKHSPAVSQYSVYLISSLASDPTMRVELGHQALISALVKTAEDNNMAEIRRTARMCLQKVSDDPSVLRSLSRQKQRSACKEDGERENIPVVESPLGDRLYWNNSRGHDEDGGTSASLDIPMTNALNEAGSLGSPINRKEPRRDDSEDRWTSESHRAKSRGLSSSEAIAREGSTNRRSKGGRSRSSSRGVSPAKRSSGRSGSGDRPVKSRGASSSRGEARNRSASKEPQFKVEQLQNNGVTKQPMEGNLVTARQDVHERNGGEQSAVENISSAGRQSRSMSEDGSFKKKKKKKKKSSKNLLANDESPPTNAEEQQLQPNVPDPPTESPVKDSQLNQIFGSGLVANSQIKIAKKLPKTAEGKPVSPRDEEDEKPVALNEGQQDSLVSADQVADTKVKPEPQSLITRRETLRNEANEWKNKAKQLKKALVEWHKEFVALHNREPDVSDKKNDKAMQDLFHSYYAATNKYKSLIVQVGEL